MDDSNMQPLPLSVFMTVAHPDGRPGANVYKNRQPLPILLRAPFHLGAVPDLTAKNKAKSITCEV